MARPKTVKAVEAPKAKKPRSRSKDGVKRGPFSNTDKAFMNSNHKRMTTDAMAAKLNRTPESIKIYLEENMALKQDGGSPLIRQLRDSADYEKYQNQFMPHEMRQLENRFLELMGQFQNDVKKTDEIHIFQLISNEIQLDRILVEQKQTLEIKLAYHAKITKLSMKEELTPDEAFKLDSWKVEFENCKANEKVLTDRQKIFQERMDKAMTALKSTREQRNKNVENRDKDFPSMIKFLMEEEELMKVGEELGMMQLARDKEYKRLSRVHKYEDGTMTPIIMNAETIAALGDESEES